MVFIDFGTDLIDYPKIFSEENRELSRKSPGIFLKVILELLGSIGIDGRILERLLELQY